MRWIISARGEASRPRAASREEGRVGTVGMNGKLKFSTLVMFLLLLSACGYSTRVLSPAQTPLASSAALPESTPTLIIEDIAVTQNGKTGNVNPGFMQRFALDLRRSGMFHAVYDASQVQERPPDAATMRLVITETLDRQWGKKVGKDIVVALSYLTLMPVMPYQMEYQVSLRATLTLPHGEVKEFESATQAAVDYKSLSDVRAAEEDLKRTATNDCVTNLLNKMRADEGLVTALALTKGLSPEAPTRAGRPLEERLRELKELREKGLVSSEEYYEKRAQLLEGI